MLGVDHMEGPVRKVMWEISWGDVPLCVEELRGRPGEENRRERVLFTYRITLCSLNYEIL